jgi:23S rRNA pseudouridine955/2504/2580 synthase/23S rRNA pseudouridine1911/1915/1917 synthase
MKRQMVFEVPGTAEGTATADFLAARFPYHDRAGWCERIGAGQVLINEQPCVPDSLLRAGDRLAYDAADAPEPPVDFTISIVSDDEDLLLVNKSGNLPCHPGGRYFNHTLWAWLKNTQGLTDFTFVNRIDRETSGLVVIAKNFAASENCRKQFSGRKVVKRYKALVEATDFPAELETAGWLVADTESAIRKKRKFIPDGSPDTPPLDLSAVALAKADAEWAETKFRLLKQCNGIALIEAEPHTGRLHQIRATLLALGTPIVGDKLYGVDETLFLRFCKDTLTDADHARLRMDRQALHASGLSFRHPKFGRPVTVDLDLPDDMQQLLGT